MQEKEQKAKEEADQEAGQKQTVASATRKCRQFLISADQMQLMDAGHTHREGNGGTSVV